MVVKNKLQSPVGTKHVVTPDFSPVKKGKVCKDGISYITGLQSGEKEKSVKLE